MPDTADSFSFDPSESPGGIAAEVAFLDKSSELRMYSIGAIQVKLHISTRMKLVL